jgi:single-stranded DNA-binding protein
MFSSSFRASTRLATSARAFSTTQRAALARMTLIGRLGVTPEEVTVSGDRTLVRYVVATNYGKREEQKTSWFRVASFVEGKQKEFLLNVPKG